LGFTGYYERVEALQGARTGTFYRLFFVPGTAHCGGGLKLPYDGDAGVGERAD
jgi:hypothetical protein